VELDPSVVFVLDRFNAMLASDGARLDVVDAGDAGDGGLTLRYVAGPRQGEDGECEACVLDPDDLDVLVADALTRQGAPTTSVTILRT
jgi:hypothetical protein